MSEYLPSNGGKPHDGSHLNHHSSISSSSSLSLKFITHQTNAAKVLTVPPTRTRTRGKQQPVSIRKKLEPLETYVPAVILTQLQIKDFEKSLEVDQPQYAVFRSILRSGPAASFRSNVRAAAQYASDDGKGKIAFDDVDRCLRALDELDSLLLRASRNNRGASAKLMKEKINVAVNALDSLLQTVPVDVLDKGRAIAEAYRTPESDGVPEELDREYKDLESIL